MTNNGGADAILTAGLSGFSSETTTFSGIIQDGNRLLALDVGTSGVLTLTGDNTYTGGTLICDCATLQLGDGGTAG